MELNFLEFGFCLKTHVIQRICVEGLTRCSMNVNTSMICNFYRFSYL